MYLKNAQLHWFFYFLCSIKLIRSLLSNHKTTFPTNQNQNIHLVLYLGHKSLWNESIYFPSNFPAKHRILLMLVQTQVIDLHYAWSRHQLSLWYHEVIKLLELLLMYFYVWFWKQSANIYLKFKTNVLQKYSFFCPKQFMKKFCYNLDERKLLLRDLLTKIFYEDRHLSHKPFTKRSQYGQITYL